MSNEARHTPRPWRFDDAGPLSGNIIRFEILAGSETEPFRVCEIEDSVPDIDAEKGAERVRAAHRDLANARLIVAAPQLLEALKALLNQHEVYGQKIVPEIESKARAAIALAEGGAA
ncbi:MAG: hypothetical protein KIS92_19995 [Planctomycetota bacterium]|nr:hypothetical protein [Planctomycetota bacterium]